MPIGGVVFEKEVNPLSRRIQRLFEETRSAYLSAKENPKEYAKKWHEAIDRLQRKFNEIDDLARDIQEVIEEKDLDSSEAKDPQSNIAENIYSALKTLRYEKDNVKDPFTKKFKENVLEKLLENKATFAMFIHWALRDGKNALSPEIWEEYSKRGDTITDGFVGLDIREKDIPTFVVEHYGDDKNSQQVKTKYKAAFSLLKTLYTNHYSEIQWKDLLGLNIFKAEKADIDFLVPNKPMYRIFEIDDINELKGFTGEWVVQEKYDGMRIQIHKIDDKIKVFSFNGKDITDKCKDQVEILKHKQFGECILDAELMLSKGDKPLHRAQVVAYVFKNKEVENGVLKAHVFDILRHNDRNLAESPLRERIQILFQNYSIHSDEKLQFPTKKDTRIADDLKDVEKYAKEIMKIPTAEGVVIKDIESTYLRGTKKNPKWIKWKKFVDLDLIVLEKKSTKTGLYSYTLGAGPVPLKEARKLQTEKIGDNYYINVGKALNTKTEVDVGDIVRVKIDEVKQNSKGQYRVYSAKVIEIPEVESPDKLITLRLLADSSNDGARISYKGEALKKSVAITDGIHGMAEVIVKSDLDGFTIFGFKDDNLMSKNALLDIDIWKEQIDEIMKANKAKLRVSIKNWIYNQPSNKADFSDILEYVTDEQKDLFEQVYDSDAKKLKNHLMNEAVDINYEGQNIFTSNESVIEKVEGYTTPEEYRHGQFKLYLREDDNLSLTFRLGKEKFGWEIQIDSIDNIFDLFGKAGKYPAKIQETVSKKKLVDKGEVELGVQRHGYHEYMLKGDKFETKLHLRVVPLKEQKQWIAFSSFVKEPVKPETDDGIWDIREDENKSLSFTTLD